MTEALFERYYPKPRYEGGTIPFFRKCREQIAVGSQILEIGAGPSNPCTKMLGQIGAVTGIDIDPAVGGNKVALETRRFRGRKDAIRREQDI